MSQRPPQGPPPGWGPPTAPQQGQPTQPGWGPPPPVPSSPKKPWYRRPLPIIGLIIVALIVIGSFSGGGGDPTVAPASTAASPGSAAPEPTEPEATEPQATAPPETAPLQPQAQTITGRGKTASKAFTITDGLAVFTMQHRGSSNFIVDLVTSKGEDVANLSNEIGNYDGSIGQPVQTGRYLFRVEADGPWTIKITQPRPASGKELPLTINGRGPKLAGPFQGTGEGVRVTMRHRGEANFIVDTLDAEGNQAENLSNEIGGFSGSTVSAAPEGVFWINVAADGTWSIQLRPL